MNIPPEKLNRVVELAHALAEALQGGQRATILAAQQALSQEVETDWAAFEASDASPKDKAVARLLAAGAIRELPQAIQDPANYPQILHELRLLKNSLVLLK